MKDLFCLNIYFFALQPDAGEVSVVEAGAFHCWVLRVHHPVGEHVPPPSAKNDLLQENRLVTDSW